MASRCFHSLLRPRGRRARPAVALGALLAGGCFIQPSRPPAPEMDQPAAGTAGAAGSSAGSSGSGGTSAGGSGGTNTPPPVPTCASDPPGLVLCDQRVHHLTPGHRELYTWTTPEQVAALRDGGRLLIVGQAEALGRGHAFTAIDELAAAGNGPAEQLLARLSSDFQYLRYAWPHPWATRMGWPGEDYGNELVRVVLRQEALIAVVRRGAVSVYDLDNQLIAVEEALAQAERIAAIFFEKDEASGGPTCIRGSFDQAIGSGGYREFILGNEAMIEEWSLSTPEIRARLEADIARLRAFHESTRGSVGAEAPQFNAQALCSWEWGGGAGELGAYLESLAIPSELYVPTAANVAAIIDSLAEDLFEPNPLVVRPGG